jgi:hypothetical protein
VKPTDEFGGPEESVPERDRFADCSKTGPGVSREEAMMEIPDWLLHEEPVVTGSRVTLQKDMPRG